MDVNTITSIISSVGFPIAACVGLFWYMTKQNEELKKAIDNNTLILTKLCERLGNRDGE